MIHLVSRAGIAYAIQCLTTRWTPFEIGVALWERYSVRTMQTTAGPMATAVRALDVERP